MNYKILLVGLFFLFSTVSAQVSGSKKKYIRIGELQSNFTAYGSERAWNNSYYEGLQWPADYSRQDNSVIKRAWFGAKNFTDSKERFWENYGLYFALDYVDLALFPVEMKQTAKFPIPDVFVDGNNINAPFKGDIDEIDPEQIPDRTITDVVNTSMGLTMTRKILAFSQQYHNNYFIKVYTFKNTGNADYDEDIELHAALTGVRISWSTRYSVSREGAAKIGDGQSWGKHTWVSKRGEDYPDHVNDQITEANPIVDWLRCGFAWAGQSERNPYDNIGAPDVKGNGRLTAPQYAGTVILHVDKSATDKADDPNQPAVLGWHAGDTYPGLGTMTADVPMRNLYNMLSGIPYQGLGGTDRFYEHYNNGNKKDPYTVHNDGGGTNVWISYGPFDLQPGDSITIVEAQAVNGLSRSMCQKIGARWESAYKNSNDKGPFDIPGGGQTGDKDVYKDQWQATGIDSLLLTFGRAKRNYDIDFKIPQAPQPPQIFEVNSGGDRISLSWNNSASEADVNFGGYRIYRAIVKPDTTYQMIFECGKGTVHPELVYTYDDKTPQRGFSYFYYVVAFSDGSENSLGTNPAGQLESSRFYTRTTDAAFLRRKAGTNLESIRVVPNPYNIRSQSIQYGREVTTQSQIMFLNIPAFCKISIFTERGDLIKTIEHTNGSGDQPWNSTTSSRQTVVSGVYIAYFEVTQNYNDPISGELLYRKGDSAYRKFIIIR